MMADDVIVSTKDRPGTYDAIETAKPDEPLFALQGGDPFAPPTILHWVKLCREAAQREPDQKKSDRLLRKARDAELVAFTFQAYQRGETEQPADVHSDDEDVQARTVREALIRGAAKLQHVLAEAIMVAETLESLGVEPGEAQRIRGGASILKAAATRIEPRRGRERS